MKKFYFVFTIVAATQDCVVQVRCQGQTRKTITSWSIERTQHFSVEEATVEESSIADGSSGSLFKRGNVVHSISAARKHRAFEWDSDATGQQPKRAFCRQVRTPKPQAVYSAPCKFFVQTKLLYKISQSLSKTKTQNQSLGFGRKFVAKICQKPRIVGTY